MICTLPLFFFLPSPALLFPSGCVPAAAPAAVFFFSLPFVLRQPSHQDLFQMGASSYPGMTQPFSMTHGSNMGAVGVRQDSMGKCFFIFLHSVSFFLSRARSTPHSALSSPNFPTGKRVTACCCFAGERVLSAGTAGRNSKLKSEMVRHCSVNVGQAKYNHTHTHTHTYTAAR